MVLNPIFYDSKGKAGDIFSKNFENRVIHLVGEVTDEMAASIIAQLLQLDSESSDEISIYINSPGGSVTAGMAIYDTMQMIRSDVSTVCVGDAASMAAVILAGGTKGKRYALKHSEVMIHQPMSQMGGQAADIILAADHIKSIRQTLNEVLSEDSGQPLDKVTKDTDRDYWMNAKEALEYGMVDKIL